eukprot:CAMPEP_0116951948 /NCGR_PEP_ID=MMETSP0467-20121206/40430_1 /TAXON_ID=283647 /ORGANISM="Mesodinium pulex, Strain SPMC105" /LENGTH=220 /DNA_ID=CAMNT_0004637105 /DNA_START=689 /DNA_END=1352 /DNA_ORIENTATION=+
MSAFVELWNEKQAEPSAQMNYFFNKDFNDLIAALLANLHHLPHSPRTGSLLEGMAVIIVKSYNYINIKFFETSTNCQDNNMLYRYNLLKQLIKHYDLLDMQPKLKKQNTFKDLHLHSQSQPQTQTQTQDTDYENHKHKDTYKFKISCSTTNQINNNNLLVSNQENTNSNNISNSRIYGMNMNGQDIATKVPETNTALRMSESTLESQKNTIAKSGLFCSS